MRNKRPEMTLPELAFLWVAFATDTFTSATSFRQGDQGWGLIFALFAAFMAVILSGAHARRRWNRRGKPDWARRDGEQS